jgi:hypothetical protein
VLGNEKPTSLQSKTAGVGVGWPLTSGDVAISTQSTLRASARSSGCRVLGSRPPVLLLIPSPVVVAETHLRTTLRADARRRGAGAVVLSPSLSLGPPVSFPLLCPSPHGGLGGIIPRTPHPSSTFQSSPCTRTPHPPCEQLLAAVVVLAGHLPGISWRTPCARCCLIATPSSTL